MMGRRAVDLAPLAVAKLKTPGLRFVGHIAGLALCVSETGARSWILRVTVGGKRRDMGLGPFPEVSLAEAKEKARKARAQVRDGGVDPIAARLAARAALKADQASFISFEDAAKQYISAHEKGWKNIKHAAQWRTTLETYAYPIIGSLHVRDVSLAHVLKIIEPMWNDKTETASRLRGRIEVVLDWAKARGFRAGDNPARWKGNLDTLLPAPGKVSKVQHHKAVDWRECSGFMAELRQIDTVGARALEFLILTNVRSGESRGARWSEISLEQGVWTIPAVRMKAEKEHRIPLSPAAVKLLKALPRTREDGLLFPNSKGTPFSDMALTMILRRMGKDFTVHGFRSTFRDWAGETTAFPREVIEHAMAHQLKDKAEAAYARGDLFIKRTALMKAWAEFLSRPAAVGKNVTSIRKRSEK
jgi:integrase